MPFSAPALALAWLAASAPQAQATAPGIPAPGTPSTTIEQGIARAIADALPNLRYPWQLNWSAFGVRGGRDVFWHLTGPDHRPLRPLPEGLHRRSGWISVRGRSGSVAVCGDAERIGGLSISVTDLWLDQGEHDVIAELSRHGVRAALLESRAADLDAVGDRDDGRGSAYYRSRIGARPALERWRLTRDGHEPADLAAVHACTPPGTRHATYCWVTWSVAFRPDEALAGADCPIEGRYGG